MRLSLPLFLFVLLAASLRAAPIEPFYPEPAPLLPYGTTTISAADVKVELPGGLELNPADYTRTRSLDGVWKLSPLERSATAFADDVDLDKGYQQVGFNDSGWADIEVPLNWYRKFPQTYKREEPYVKGTYRKDFTLSAADMEERVLIHFGVVGYDAMVFVNGHLAGRHKGDFTPFQFDITPYVKEGQNVLAVRVLSDFGPARGTVEAANHVYGAQWNWQDIKGGIWQPVTLRFEPALRFNAVLISPDLQSNTLRVDYEIDNRTGREGLVDLGFAVSTALKTDPNQLNAAPPAEQVTLRPGLNTGTAYVRLNEPEKWSPHNPFLYYLTSYLRMGDTVLSVSVERFGFRDFRIEDGKFFLNGERIYLFGENLSAPYYGGIGNTQEVDRQRLHERIAGFKSLGVNMIRFAHMPIIPDAMEIADEVGMLVYNEWGWCFTNKIDEPAFQENNDKELVEWVRRDYNYPSVVMWTGGNEVRHQDNPAVKRQLDRQVAIVRQLDKSGRPVGSFSGSASWMSYGTEPLNTEFLDLHTYGGLSAPAWTVYNGLIENFYQGSLGHYGKAQELGMPYVVWECVGFSWGGKADPEFKLNDIDAYARYANTRTSWGQPNGIGFAGSIGLAAALDPERGNQYGKELFGHRLLELTRQNERVDGFAPWFHGYNLAAATLWNQPVLPGIRNGQGLPPVNFFAGDGAALELYAANSTNDAIEGAVFEVRMVDESGAEVQIARVEAPALPAWSVTALPATLELPLPATPHAQLRVVLSDAEGNEIGRNFYNVGVRSRDLLAEPVVARGKVALLNVGNAADVEATGKVLKDLGIAFDVVPAASLSNAYKAAIVPAGLNATGRLDLNGQALLQWMQKGGRLLVLEQKDSSHAVLPNSRLLKSDLPYADLAIPEHPIFAGLSQRDFDQWENPDNGMVIRSSITPFSTNALAVRGPFLGSQSVGNAVMEATVGQGRVLWTQLDATKLWGVDSAASQYLRNVFDYALSDAKRYAKARPLQAGPDANYSIPQGREVFVDLSAHANRGFADDGKGGGWTGQGANDFRSMPVGAQVVNGVPFKIIDPAANNGKGALAVRGSQKPDFPARISGIPVNEKLTRIFFIHTCAWKGEDAGRYRVNYADGTHYDYLLVNGKNIGDWWESVLLTDALPGIVGDNELAGQVSTYMAVMENPHPDKTITSIDFLSAGADGEIDYLPRNAPVPLLVAVTGEAYNPQALQAPSEGPRAIWREGSRGGLPRPQVSMVKDAKMGEVAKIVLPAAGQGSNEEMAFAFCRFPEQEFDLERYRYLTFYIKTDAPGALDVVIPEKDWKKNMSASIELDARYSDWQKVRLDLRESMRADAFGSSEPRGELFFYNGNNKRFMYPRPELTFYITDIRFE